MFIYIIVKIVLRTLASSPRWPLQQLPLLLPLLQLRLRTRKKRRRSRRVTTTWASVSSTKPVLVEPDIGRTRPIGVWPASDLSPVALHLVHVDRSAPPGWTPIWRPTCLMFVFVIKAAYRKLFFYLLTVNYMETPILTRKIETGPQILSARYVNLTKASNMLWKELGSAFL